MPAVHTLSDSPAASLSEAFLLHYPLDAARRLESMSSKDIARILDHMPDQAVVSVVEKVTPGALESIIEHMTAGDVAALLARLSATTAITLLSRLDRAQVNEYLELLDRRIADEFRSLLEYPENSAGRLMNPRIIAFNESTSVQQALDQLRKQGVDTIRHLFLLNDELQLQSQVDVRRLALADDHARLSAIAVPIATFVHATDPREDVTSRLEKFRVDVLPVVDLDYRLVGVIEGQGIVDALREDVVTDMQTMVGASKDERALSSSLFAVRKRLPWLQINLLTAFLAAAVVGIFEDTIAQFTALAVLLPIAAGQSGNTGAQALAVTMRGLTLREITLRDWFRVVMKELVAGALNGVGVAAVCAAGVYLWSSSEGLALVMALSMLISMTIAGVSGALVPIVLKRLGQDPAQSSSIVLTTVTDITGFMAFLGIATLLSGMLAA